MSEFELKCFDIQLFNVEGEGEGNSDTDTGSQDPEEVEDVEEVDPEGGDDSEPSGDPLALPSKLGLKDGRLEYVEDEDEGEDEPDDGKGGEKQEIPTGTQSDGKNSPSFYSPEELSQLATDVTKLDPTRIPPEAIPFYRAMVASQVKPPEVKEPKQEEKDTTEDKGETVPTVTDSALKEVTKILSKKGEEYDPFSTEHQALLFQEIAKIDREKADISTKKQARETEQKQTDAMFAAEIAVAQKTDGADFDGIDKLAAEHLQTLPYQKAAPIAAAIQRLSQNQLTQADIPVIKGYWDDCRREYFAKKTGVGKDPKVIPPQVQKPGSNPKESRERFNPKEIGKMDQDSRIEYYKRTGLADKFTNLG
jgi:hypothetical protein